MTRLAGYANCLKKKFLRDYIHGRYFNRGQTHRKLHLGHYVGSLKRRVEMQNSGNYQNIYIMIADAQALTDNADDINKVRNNISEVALDYLACGLDPKSDDFYSIADSRTLRVIFLLYEFGYGFSFATESDG